MAWAIDKWLWVISNIMLFYKTKKLQNKVILNLKQHCMHCYVVLSSVFKLFRGSLSIHSSLANQGPANKARPIKTVKVCLYLMLFKT